jgi:hypothetical protein
MYETLHGLHSNTFTSCGLVRATIVRATLIGRQQFGHFGNWGVTICSSLSGVTPVAGKGSDILTGGPMRVRSVFPCTRRAVPLIINLKPTEALKQAVPLKVLAPPMR